MADVGPRLRLPGGCSRPERGPGIVPQLKHAFHVGDFGIGVVLSAFVVFNGVVTLPAGYLADRWVRTRAVAIAMGAWSVVSVAGAMAPTFSVLVFLRGVLGFGQGVTDPSTGSLLPYYYELERRGRAFSVQQSLILVGTGVGVLAGGIIGPTLGWRAAFVFTSIPGLVVAFLIYRLREPKRGAADRLRMGVTDRIEYADEAVLDGTADAEPGSRSSNTGRSGSPSISWSASVGTWGSSWPFPL